MWVRVLMVAAVAAAGVSGCESTKRFWNRGQLVAEPEACAPKRFEVYFADSEARLTAAAREAIGATAAQLQGCDIRKVEVLGLADARGGVQANLTLSQRRAQAVAEALAATGWPAPVFEVGAAGEAGATAGGVNEPMRRRTEVLVEAAPRR